MKRKVLFIVAIACIFFALPPLAALADGSAAPTVSGDRNEIFANGTPLLILEDGSDDVTVKTTLYIDANGNGALDDGEQSLQEAGIDNAPADASYLGLYSIYGGSKEGAYTGDTKITMRGGRVGSLIGGGYASTADVTGNTSVTVSGGRANVYGGGNYGEVTGNTVVTLSGGTIGEAYGGGAYLGSTVGGNSSVSISGSAEVSVAYGGAFQSEVTGHALVSITGGSVWRVFGEGYANSARVRGGVTVSVAEGGVVQDNIRGGGRYENATGGVDLTIPENMAARTGYTFAGWFTDEEKVTPVTYTDGTYTTSSQEEILYAGWIPNTYTVAFDGSGATGGIMDNQSFTYDTAQALMTNAFEKKYTVTYDSRGGAVSPENAEAEYGFSGWETDDNLSPVYTNGQSVSNLTAANGATVTLSALWSDAPVTLPSSDRTGYTLAGWYTAADGGGTKAGDAGDAYTPRDNITLYADWNAIPNRMTEVAASTTAGVTVNTGYTLDLSTIFEDSENDPLSYKVSVNAGAETTADESYSYIPAAAGTFMLVFKANDGSADSADTYTVTLTAQQASSNSGGSGGGGGGGTQPPSQNVDNITRGSTTTTGTTLTGTTEGSTKAGSVASDTASALVNNAKAAEKAGNKAVVEIKLETGSNIRAAEITVPKAAFDSLASDTDADLKIGAGIGTVTFDSTAVGAISAAASSGNITISMAKADTTALSDTLKALVGGRPIFDFTVTAGGRPVSDFGGGKAKISVPYTPAPGEDKNAIVVYYISDSGILMRVRGSYNETTGTVDFFTTHFSLYAVGYNKLQFGDVSDTAWYHGAVTFLAARDITRGTENGNFSPSAKLTRGQFIVMLMRAYGIDPDENSDDNFSDAGNSYQTGYLAAAKRLDISRGVGGNLFEPECRISRQEMFTLLYRALNVLSELPEGNSSKAAGDFNDAGQIAPYAKDAMNALTKAGVISGSGGKLNPTATTTRAEMAQVLYTLLSEQQANTI